MSALAKVKELGARPRLSPDGRLLLGGLDTLPRERAQRALEIARANKAEIVNRLSTAPDIPTLDPEQCREVHKWQPATQRLFVAILDHFEGKGFILTEAEALTYATIKELERRKGGPVGLLPAELNESLHMVRAVFGPGVRVESITLESEDDYGHNPGTAQ